MDIWLPPKPAIIRPASDDLRRDWRREPKKASFLPGWYPAGVAGKRPIFNLLSAGDDSGNTSGYEFFDLPFGVAAVDRLLIAALGGGSASSVTSVSATIGGVAATVHAQAHNTGNTRNGHAAVVSALVPAGTSGSLAVTWNGGMLDMAYALFSATGLISTTPTDTATASDNSPTMLIDRAQEGFIIAAASAQGASSVTWPSPMVTAVDSNTDGTFESMGYTPVVFSAASNFNAGPSTPGGGGPSRYAAASWA